MLEKPLRASSNAATFAVFTTAICASATECKKTARKNNRKVSRFIRLSLLLPTNGDIFGKPRDRPILLFKPFAVKDLGERTAGAPKRVFRLGMSMHAADHSIGFTRQALRWNYSV